MFFSCHRIISHDRIYVERMFWGPPDRFSSPTEKIIAKIIIRICPFRQILSCSNLPTSSVELIWPITELYFRQILSTDFMNRFCQDVKTGPYGGENVKTFVYSLFPLACPCRGGPRSASGRITRKYHSTKTETRARASY